MGKQRDVRISRREAREARREDQQEKYKAKFKEERELPPIVPLTEKQARYINLINTQRIILAEGDFGTGKTFVPSVIAADLLRRNEIEKIIVARPYVQTGRSSGFKPGSSLEKLYPYVRTMLDTVRIRMGDGAFYNALKDGLHGRIEVQELESIRGRSFDEPSFLLIDEAQQTTPEEMLSIVTRVSDNCTLVIMGDDSQKDIHGMSGLRWARDFFTRNNIRGFGCIDFYDEEDNVRGGMSREIAKGLKRDLQNGYYTPMAS